MTYNTGNSKTPKAIHDELERIEAALGDTLCSDERPCGTAAYYDEGKDTPWRIADDYSDEEFATADEAVAAAADWIKAYASQQV